MRRIASAFILGLATVLIACEPRSITDVNITITQDTTMKSIVVSRVQKPEMSLSYGSIEDNLILVCVPKGMQLQHEPSSTAPLIFVENWSIGPSHEATACDLNHDAWDVRLGIRANSLNDATIYDSFWSLGGSERTEVSFKVHVTQPEKG